MSRDEFVLKIATDNEAFKANMSVYDYQERALEVARILRKAADKIQRNGDVAGSLQDANGNTVGHFEFK